MADEWLRGAIAGGVRSKLEADEISRASVAVLVFSMLASVFLSSQKNDTWGVSSAIYAPTDVNNVSVFEGVSLSRE